MHGLVRIPNLDARTKLDSRSIIMQTFVAKMFDVFDVMSPDRKSACASRFA